MTLKQRRAQRQARLCSDELRSIASRPPVQPAPSLTTRNRIAQLGKVSHRNLATGQSFADGGMARVGAAKLKLLS